MRLLMLSNYFTPDLSAGSFRMQALVDALEAWRDRGLEVTLITTGPNRYASLRTEAPEFEDREWLKIHRIAMPAHKSGMGDQARSYARYAWGVHQVTKGQQWDAIFATSSRLMTAGLGAQLAKRLGAPLFLDIRDLFTDNMDELLARSPLKGLMPAFHWIERTAFAQADRINVVSDGFVPHVRRLAPGTPISVHTNGIDALFADADFTQAKTQHTAPLIVYAGNMGEGQGLHRIVPEVAALLGPKVRFRLIGDGGRRKLLEEAIANRQLHNIELLPAVPRQQLLEQYREADILFLHLNDLDAFRKVLPSKVFEYGATGKPILAGVAGSAAQFLADHLPDAAVFAPLDAAAMARAIERLIAQPVERSRADFAKQFDRSTIMQNLAREIVTMAEGQQ